MEMKMFAMRTFPAVLAVVFLAGLVFGTNVEHGGPRGKSPAAASAQLQSLAVPLHNELKLNANERELTGFIYLKVQKANNLPPVRPPKTELDPFASVTFGDDVFRTRVVQGSLNPVWDETVVLPLPKKLARRPISIAVHDRAQFTTSDCVGSVDLPVAKLMVADRKPDEPLVLNLNSANQGAAPTGNSQEGVAAGSVVVTGRFEPIDQVRAQLWRSLLELFDVDGDKHFGPEKMILVLDILGNTDDSLLREGYKAINKTEKDRLTLDEGVQFFEKLLNVHQNDESLSSLPSCPFCQAQLTGAVGHQVILHLASCVASGQANVERLMMGGFMYNAQTSQIAVNKLGNRLARRGENSATVLVINRETRKKEEEKMPTFVRLGIRLLYKPLLFSLDWVLTKRWLKWMTERYGRKYTNPDSKKDIDPFIKYHSLNMSEIRDPIDSFSNFNEFFYRKLKPGVRTLDSPDDPTVAASIADCRLMAFPTIEKAQELWIKGRNFSVAGLLQSDVEARRFEGGSLLIFRLAPQDYHRFHIPVDGTLVSRTNISGEYYTVNPMAIRTTLDVFVENKRTVSMIDSEQFGRVAYVSIGATMVGSIVHSAHPQQKVRRMDEMGYFAFGGSTIVLLFEKNRLVIDKDIQANSNDRIETLVKVGQSVGRTPGSKSVSRWDTAALGQEGNIGQAAPAA